MINREQQREKDGGEEEGRRKRKKVALRNIWGYDAAIFVASLDFLKVVGTLFSDLLCQQQKTWAGK